MFNDRTKFSKVIVRLDFVKINISKEKTFPINTKSIKLIAGDSV